MRVRKTRQHVLPGLEPYSYHTRVSSHRRMRLKVEVLEARVRELEDALENLVDHQNGPPYSRPSGWEMAMDMAEKALGRS